MRRAIALALALALCGAGCSHVTSTVHSDPGLSGELWYVRSTSLFGMLLGSSIWHCNPTIGGAVTCTEARIELDGPAGRMTQPSAVDATSQAGAEKPESGERRNLAIDFDQSLWNAATAATADVQACEEVSALLSRDSDCSEEQCRPSLALAVVYGHRCEGAPDEQRALVKKLRTKWGKEVVGQPSNCYSMLLRSLTSSEDAKAYRRQCIEDRTVGQVEEAILSAGAKSKPRR